MSHLILKLFAWPASELAGLDVKPRPSDDGVGASPDANETAKPRRRDWLWFGPGSEVDISRANFTSVEDSMLNLP